MENRGTLTPTGAILTGLGFAACGIPPLLIAAGAIVPEGDVPPPWVTASAGLLFVFAGMLIVLDYAVAGGVAADGELPPGTPLAVRGANLLLGMAVVGLMTAVFGWVAFGSGPRAFSSSLSLPFLAHEAPSSERSGRIAFGVGTVVFALMFVACGIVGVRRFVRALRQAR